MLVMESRRAGHDAHIDPGREDVAIVLARKFEAKSLADLFEQLGALAAHADELELVTARARASADATRPPMSRRR